VSPYKQRASVYVVDLQQQTPQAVAHFEGPEGIRQLAWSSDGRSVIVRGLPSALTVSKQGRKAMIEQSWNLDAPRAEPETPRKAPPKSSASKSTPSKSAPAKLSSSTKKKPPEPPRASASAPSIGAFSEPVEIRDSGMISSLLGSESLSPCLEDISPDASMVAIDIGTSISIRDLSTDKERFRISSRSASVGAFTDILPIPSGEPIFAANTSAHGTFVLDQGELTMLSRPTLPEQMSWQPDGKALAAMGDGWLQIWKRTEHWGVRSFTHESPTERSVRRMIWGKNGIIASLSVEGAMAHLESWDSEKGWLSKLTSYDAEMAEKSAAIRFSGDGSLLVGVGAAVESWDARAGKQLATRAYPVESIKGISPDTSRLIAETTDGLVVIDRASGATLVKLADPGATKNDLGKRSLTWSDDGARVSSVIGEAGAWRARAWRVTDGALLAEISGGGAVPRTRWISTSDLAVTASTGLEIHHLTDCTKVELTPLSVDGTEHLVVEGPNGWFDASDAATEVLALTEPEREDSRRILVGDLLKSRRRPGLWPLAPQFR
jgi:uncharacterized membrane protein